MLKTKYVLRSMLLIFVLSFLAGCSGRTPETVLKRNEAIGIRSAQSNFYEAQQINAIEDWKDDPSKIVNVYVVNPVTGGLLVPVIRCMGVPASSTESLEPNDGVPWYSSGGGTYWRIPIDGMDVGTTEMPGRDGSFGEPVPFRQCMDVSGNYQDWSIYSLVLVSSASYTFPEATVKRDFEDEARLLIAEEIIANGGCVNAETLEEIECSASTPVESIESSEVITQ